MGFPQGSSERIKICHQTRLSLMAYFLENLLKKFILTSFFIFIKKTRYFLSSASQSRKSSGLEKFFTHSIALCGKTNPCKSTGSLFLHTSQIKWRDVLLLSRRFFLRISLLNPQRQQMLVDLVVFIGGNSSVDLWV